MNIPERIPLSSHTRMRIAWFIFVSSLIGWPLSHIWVLLVNGFDPFEQLVLALSWWAVTTTAWDVLSTSDVSAEQQSE